MSTNIACYIPNCTKPVVGQCAGYPQGCGRFYCHNHSSDGLCLICAEQKENDPVRIYNTYLKKAEELESEANTAINTKAVFKKGAKIAAVLGLLFGPIYYIANPREGSPIVGLIVGPLGFLVYYTILIGPLIWIICSGLRGIWHINNGRSRAEEINKTMPGFINFYSTWRKEKNKEKLKNTLVVAGVIVGSAIVAAASESDYDRTRRAVRDEINRN